MIGILLLIALAGSPAQAQDLDPGWPTLKGQPKPGSPHFDLEVLYARGKHNEGLAEAKKRLAANPQDVDLHWMVARFMFEVGEVIDKNSGVDKEAHYAEMVAIAEKGLKLSPGHPHLRFARAIGMGRLGTTRGVLSSLFMAKHVEADLLAASTGPAYASLSGMERIPCDPYLGLGIYYRLLPDWWIIKVMAGTRGSLDKSLSYLEKAVQCGPGRMGTVKELGVTQMCIGTKRGDTAMIDKGKATVRSMLAMPVKRPVDKIDIAHGKKLLADPKMACGYSRDGQQELDRKKLE